jgi:hypothetical protein
MSQFKIYPVINNVFTSAHLILRINRKDIVHSLLEILANKKSLHMGIEVLTATVAESSVF